MNILFFTSNFEPKDGWSAVGFNIVKNLNEFNIEVFSSEDKSKLSFGKKKLKSELFEKFKYISLIFDFFNVIINTKNKPDLIHCNVEHYAPVAMWLSKIYKVPYTITAHGTYGVVLPLKYKIYRKAFKCASSVITVSNFTKKRMMEEKIEANYEVILNGVNKNKFKVNDLIKKENIITFVGNLKPRKGLSFLLNSMVKVNAVKPEIKLIVIGSIDFKSEAYIKIKSYIESNNLNVEFVGKVTEKELVLYYQKAKINVLPSQSEPLFFEGFGLIHLEANACGTLSIGTYNSGNEDAIIPKNGYLVNYGNVNELSSKILHVFEMEKYPKISYLELDDWNNVATKYQRVFERVIL